ncbi:hypothetical protein PO909_032925, partial [Leuciscus waleckii]
VCTTKGCRKVAHQPHACEHEVYYENLHALKALRFVSDLIQLSFIQATMMSYVWIFVLGSLIVTGVKMQENGVEGAENGDNTPAEDLPPASDDEALTDAEPPTKETVDEVVDEATDLTETEAEETKPDSDAAEDEQPVTEAPAAGEEPVEGEAPIEAVDKADAPETEADPPTEETDVTEQEITPEEATGEVEEQPTPESPDQEEPVQEEPVQEELDQEEPDQEKPDQEEPDKDSGVVTDEPVNIDEPVNTDEEVNIDEEVKVQSRGFDLSDAFSEDTGEVDIGDADKQSADHGKAHSAGAASGPKDSGSGTVVGVVCGIAVAAVGAITGYFTYQKKKLCFKVQRGDPESAKEENGTQSDPQVLSTLLDSP